MSALIGVGCCVGGFEMRYWGVLGASAGEGEEKEEGDEEGEIAGGSGERTATADGLITSVASIFVIVLTPSAATCFFGDLLALGACLLRVLGVSALFVVAILCGRRLCAGFVVMPFCGGIGGGGFVVAFLGRPFGSFGETTRLIALGHAFFALWASDEITGFDALSSDTTLISGALDDFAGVAHTDIIFAAQPLWAFIATATLSALALVTDESSGAEGVGAFVIDHAIAIVVFAVADLVGGLRSSTSAPCTGGTGLCAFTAGGTARAFDIVVDTPVAIVVFAVAFFGFGLRAGTSAPCAIDTSGRTFPTSACTRLGSEAVVDLTVAIVIKAVALFGLGFLSITKDPLTGNTALVSATASGRARAGEAVVDLSVAIVVDVVACLGGGLTGCTGCPCARLADLKAATTSILTASRQVVVDQAVAVVIEAIADLGARRKGSARTLYARTIGATDEDAIGATSACAHRARLAFGGKGFIDLPVAIVVESIADLGVIGEGCAQLVVVFVAFIAGTFSCAVIIGHNEDLAGEVGNGHDRGGEEKPLAGVDGIGGDDDRKALFVAVGIALVDGDRDLGGHPLAALVPEPDSRFEAAGRGITTKAQIAHHQVGGIEDALALVILAEVIESGGRPIFEGLARGLSKAMSGGAEGIGGACTDIGDIVGVLVPDITGIDPIVHCIAKDAESGHGAVVGTEDDLGAVIIIDIDDHGVFEGGGGAVGGGVEDLPILAVEDAHKEFVIVDGLGFSVAFKVKDGGACDGGRVVLCLELPEEAELIRCKIGGIDDVIISASGGDIRLSIAVEIADSGGASAAAGDRDAHHEYACLAVMDAQHT